MKKMCEKVFAHDEKFNNVTEKAKRKALKEKDMHQVSNVKDALGTNPVIMLERERFAWTEFKNYAWIAGVSAKLAESKALILRSLLNSTPICVLSEIIAIIFDTGASTSLTPFCRTLKVK